MTTFKGKLALQQRVLTTYRAPFFDFLAQGCAEGLSVCAGLPLPKESISVTDSLHVAKFQPVQNYHLFSGPLLLCYQRGVQEWLVEWNPDVLITEVNPRTISTPSAIKWMKKCNRPVVGWGLGSPPPVSFPQFLKKTGEWVVDSTLRRYLRRFDALLTYSTKGAEEYASLGFPAEKIFIAPNAATPPPSQPMPDRPEQFKGKPNVLFVGRLQARKKVDLLLQACAALPLTLQPNLTIVGDGPAYSSLVELAKQIYPTAEFPGPLHGEALARFFNQADLFILPGTGGLAVQEAMTYGLPIIMGAGDGTNDDLVRPTNGWQFSRPEELIDILRLALSDVRGLREKGTASYNIVSQEINLVTMREGFLKAINQVLPC
jgi:glycosyltransferase involved in cell wall biosynthesis